MKEKERAEAELLRNMARSGVRPNPVGVGAPEVIGVEAPVREEVIGVEAPVGEEVVGVEAPVGEEVLTLGYESEDSAELPGASFTFLVRAKDKASEDRSAVWNLQVSRAELQQLQEQDESLEDMRKASREGIVRRGKRFLWREGLQSYLRRAEKQSCISLIQYLLQDTWVERKPRTEFFVGFTGRHYSLMLLIFVAVVKELSQEGSKSFPDILANYVGAV